MHQPWQGLKDVVDKRHAILYNDCVPFKYFCAFCDWEQEEEPAIMKVNIKQVPPGGKPFEVQAELDLSQLRRWGVCPIPSPVMVQAVFRNKNGVVTVAYTARYTLESVCARCLEPVEKALCLEASHTLLERVEDEKHDTYILVPDAVLDLQELVWADVSLELVNLPLCGENCKGLCPVCGENRNHVDCGCRIPEPERPIGAPNPFLADNER